MSKPLRLALAGLLVVAAAALLRALVTRDGVGAFEYAAGAVIVVALLVGAVRVTHGTMRRA